MVDGAVDAGVAEELEAEEGGESAGGLIGDLVEGVVVCGGVDAHGGSLRDDDAGGDVSSYGVGEE